MSRSLPFLLAVVSVAGLSVSAPDLQAQTPSSPPQKDLKLSTSKPEVTPLPDPPVIAQDADQVAAGIEQRERDEKLIREEILEPRRRPDLEYDVVNGIQSLNANKARGGR